MTTHDVEELRRLLERVEGASGRNKELGREVLLALGWKRSIVGCFYGPLYSWSPPHFSKCILSGDDDDLPDITASLDAALALVEGVLPGWAWSLSGPDKYAGSGGDAAYALMAADFTVGGPEPWEIDRPCCDAHGKTPALALLSALLRALIVQAEQKEPA